MQTIYIYIYIYIYIFILVRVEGLYLEDGQENGKYHNVLGLISALHPLALLGASETRGVSVVQFGVIVFFK